MKAIIEAKSGSLRDDIEKLVGKVKKFHISIDRVFTHEPTKTPSNAVYYEMKILADGETVATVFMDPGELEKATKVV